MKNDFVVLLKTDGSTEVKNIQNTEYSTLAKLIGCDWIEIVRPVGNDGRKKNFVLIVDEEGLLKSESHWNPLASYMYGFTRHGSPIVGDALIMREIYSDEGPELAGYTESEARDWDNVLDDMILDVLIGHKEDDGNV